MGRLLFSGFGRRRQQSCSLGGENRILLEMYKVRPSFDGPCIECRFLLYRDSDQFGNRGYLEATLSALISYDPYGQQHENCKNNKESDNFAGEMRFTHVKAGMSGAFNARSFYHLHTKRSSALAPCSHELLQTTTDSRKTPAVASQSARGRSKHFLKANWHLAFAVSFLYSQMICLWLSEHSADLRQSKSPDMSAVDRGDHVPLL